MINVQKIPFTIPNIERAKRLLVSQDPDSIKKGPHGVTRFIKRLSTSKSGDKVTDSYYIDQSARPVHHRNRERIIAHFMICYTVLLIYRLLEAKLDDYGTHFTTDNIIETLKNMEVVNVRDMY